MPQIAAHRQDQGEGFAGWLPQAQRWIAEETGPSTGCGKAVVAIEPL